MLLAGLLFSGSLKQTDNVAFAYGANLLGAMLGGVGEYLALVMGYRLLLVVIALCYLAAILLYPKTRLPPPAPRFNCCLDGQAARPSAPRSRNARHEPPTLSASRCTSVLPLPALVAAAWLGAVAIVEAQPTYRLVEIAPGESRDIDPTGTYVTGTASTDLGARAFLWSGGAPVLVGGVGSQGYGVNASGQVVGARGLLPYRWSAGTATPLESLFGSFTAPPLPDDAIPLSGFGELSAAALSINAAGQAVGRSDVTGSTGRAVLWAAGSASVTILPEHPDLWYRSQARAHQRRRRRGRLH